MINNLGLTGLNKTKAIAIGFIVLALLVWVDPFAFFKSDDWSFIMRYASNDYLSGGYIFEGHGAHVIPLFKSIYYLELSVFGKNALCFQILSVLLWGILSYAFFKLCQQINPSKSALALLISLLFCLHPNFADILYWIFQQGVILHLLFQILTILYYFIYLKERTSGKLFLFLILLIGQNYFFGNGVLFPCLFIFHSILEDRKLLSKHLVVLIGIQIIFLVIQKSFSQEEIGILSVFENSASIVISFLKLIYVSVTRFFFIRNFAGSYLLALALLLFFIQAYFAFRNHGKLFFFSIVYLVISTISMAIGRSQIASMPENEIHYYYSILLFPPLFMMLFLALSGFRTKQHHKIITGVLTVYAIVFTAVNIQAKRIYSYRNFKNKEAMNNAVLYSKINYYPFDDAMFSNGQNLYLDNILNPEVQKSLLKNNYFKADSNIINYLGKRNYDTFTEENRKMINSYKYLEEHSLFDLDINYEKK